jgi:hypothetical protein
MCKRILKWVGQTQPLKNRIKPEKLSCAHLPFGGKYWLLISAVLLKKKRLVNLFS